MAPKDIIQDIDAYMQQHGGQARDWYVGIAADPADRLFNGHGVTPRVGIYIYRPANSANDARMVEKAYLDTGHDGGPGGGDYSTRHVYAYKKVAGTRR